jgi:tetratricopeptide (TPR) repeat protein
LKGSLNVCIGMQNWTEAAIRAGNLSELHLTLGDIEAAVEIGKTCIAHANRSGDLQSYVLSRTTLADALHQMGDLASAQALFKEAETRFSKERPHEPWLWSLWGYRYCDLLLGLTRHAEVVRRATYATEFAKRHNWRLVALDYLSLGRATLALGGHAEARVHLDQALDALREAGTLNHLTRGLLARAALFREIDDPTAARRDLDEAMRIARRGEMRLLQCDAHLEYARLALAEGDKDQARGHVAEARRLVEETGYSRRRSEVEELEAKLR